LPETAPSQKSAPGRLAEGVYAELVNRIVSGRLRQGDPVSILALSKELGVSRTPVHEAVAHLIKDGLLEQSTHHRPEVAAFGRADIIEIFDMRQLLDGEAAARAADRISSEELTRLRGEADDWAARSDRPDWEERWASLDTSFHAAIADAADHRRLAEDTHRYRLLHRSLNLTHNQVDLLREANAEHLRILDALERRDAEAARAAMADHIGRWQEFFADALP